MNKTHDKYSELLSQMQEDLIKVYETIEKSGHRDIYEIEEFESFPIKTLLSNIDCAIDELKTLEQ